MIGTNGNSEYPVYGFSTIVLWLIGNLSSYLIVINPFDTRFSLWLAQTEIQSIQFMDFRQLCCDLLGIYLRIWLWLTPLIPGLVYDWHKRKFRVSSLLIFEKLCCDLLGIYLRIWLWLTPLIPGLVYDWHKRKFRVSSLLILVWWRSIPTGLAQFWYHGTWVINLLK